MEPRARRATSYDVARAAGVSQSTVSRCFHGDSNIAADTRAKIIGIARQLGYVPNALARSLITQRSNMVGVIATSYTLRGTPDTVFAIGEALAAAGKQVMLVTAPGDSPSAADLRGVLEYPLDGLISCVLIADDVITEIQQRGIPLVLYNRRSPRIAVDSVASNHRQASSEVADALYAAGHRDFLCVSGPTDAPVSRERCGGFLDRLACLGIPEVPVIETDYSYADGHDRFLAHTSRPHAVFCANDQLALGVMDACRFTLGLAVPADISVVGFDDIVEAGRPSYRLTTMHQDAVKMARQAVGLLLERLKTPDLPVNHLEVEARWAERASAIIKAKEGEGSALDPLKAEP